MTVRKLIVVDGEKATMKEKFASMIAGHPRVEMGAVQFNDDWPGLFIRGDKCIDLWNRLEGLKRLLETHVPETAKSEMDYMIGMPAINDLIRMISEDVLIKPSGDMLGADNLGAYT